MLIYIQYGLHIDKNIMKMWLNHYNQLRVKFGIYVLPELVAEFTEHFPLSIEHVVVSPPSVVKLRETDFLFPYTHTEDGTMILSYIPPPSFYNDINTNVCIGRVYSVSVENQSFYSTFEIPDFIVYQHRHHTNFTEDGIRPQSSTISNSVVCLSMLPSKIQNKNEYYETNIVIHRYIDAEKIVFKNVYWTYNLNIIVNKEKGYGIVWFPKCGCTTIVNLFCQINGISLENTQEKRSLAFHLQQYRYNQYLQGIHLIGFVRNPYERFLSSFVDKNIIQTDSIYLSLDGYKKYRESYSVDTMENFCDFLEKGGYISNHYLPVSRYNQDIPYFKELKYPIYKIEDNMNQVLYDFFKQYHYNVDREYVLGKRDNSIVDTSLKEGIIGSSVVYFDESQWKEYLKNYRINYRTIIRSNIELKNRLYRYFEKDFIQYGYSYNI